MDHRHGPATQRPLPPHRAVSGSYTLQQGLRRPPLPSRLSNVRSVSQPTPNNVVDLTGDAPKSTHAKNTAAFLSNHDDVSRSPDVMNLEDEDDNGRPAKRAKIGGHGFRGGEGREGTPEHGTDTAHLTLPGSPLPQLPKPNASANRNPSQRRSRPVVDRLARKANGLEPPAMATRLPAPRGVADFSPWTGHHPEDILSETVVKAGYFDKPPGPNSTESNSAKPAIWPNLSQKNNMGLQTLSYLFTSIMEKRLAMGKRTAPSTFKPPPRVTVTDTKREAWLKDLANPEVPLRKQSRTIPHGIRGKVLMEQCLGKDIPMPRAVWLAKCVGANELRAFRRKGVSGANAVSGEQKWIRDWTVNIEQFLEGVIALCGQPEWQAKMDYAVKLATAFYSERLLERDHYLDWIVTSLGETSIPRLPIWVILAQLYWKDITAFGRRGRQLAEAVLAKLHEVSTGVVQLNDSLKERLKKLIVILAVTNRGCLIMPRAWEKYRYLLEPMSLSGKAAPLETPARNVQRRNERLTGPLLKTSQNTRCALLELYSALDTIGIHFDIQALTSACLLKVPYLQNLVCALLDWSASVYRTGLSRVYLVAKIIEELHSRGHDIDAVVLHYLTSANTTCISIANVHRVVAELVRARCFSASRYLQRLMTSGALSAGQGASLITGLLTALPVDALSENLINTREALMGRLGQSPDETAAIRQLNYAINLENGSFQIPVAKALSQLENISTSARMRFARDYCTRVMAWAKHSGLSIGCFCSMRDTLERCQDLQALADVVDAAMESEDPILLAAVCDTVNLHSQSFAALGCLPPKFDRLWVRYRTLRSQQPLDRTFILALGALTRQLPDQTMYLQLLESDLAYCESQNSMAACSPASDSLVSMQASSLESDNDMDAVFASGNTMDEQLMQRVFSRIVQRAGKPRLLEGDETSRICSWFNQLRAVDITGFNQLVKKYLRTSLQSSAQNEDSIKVIASLIASSCLHLNSVVEVARDLKTPAASSKAIQLVSCAISNETLGPMEAFRFRARQRQFAKEHEAKVIALLTTSMEDPRFPAHDQGLVDMVLDYAVGTHAGDFAKIYTNALQKSSIYLGNCQRLVQNILQRSGNQDAASCDVRSLIALADPLSAVHCSAALAMSSRTEPKTDIQGAIMEAISHGCEVWPQLLEAAGQETIRGIYQWALDDVLNGVLGSDGTILPDQNRIQRRLDILDVAYHAEKGDDNARIVSSVTDKMRAIEHRLSSLEPYELGNHSTTPLLCSFQVLLHLSILYAVSPSDDSDALKQSRSNLLSTLCSLMLQENLQTQQGLLEYIYDVASAVADTLPIETLSALTKSVTAKDPRLASVLGITPSPDAWLNLASHPQAAGTQQQRAMMRQSQPQQQAGRQPASATPSGSKAPVRPVGETKMVPFPLRRWEIMGDATPAMGDNDTSLSLALFGARKV
ncbi:Mediator of RNA polymerase II transcription subunit 12 [Lecanosticta acicola]|uniref:Mediator of RNA polymerase II transcription subunit 12 n=1 Tax=Lecanosticta acicola TaxID=111012 RepID=A0AAI8W237_9PEZI|nr:Mediator of RNA polymerase II transcription subunit 12 [Lecanosticta acicola]